MTKIQLPRCTPESQGILSAAIIGFVDEMEKNINELHSFMLLRHGAVVAEGWWSPYTPKRPHMLFSLTKSFTSTAIGLAVAEGRLSVNDPVISFFPDDVPAEVSENLRSMRVKQLLSMSTGHAFEPTDKVTNQPDPNWVKAFLALPVEYKPGTLFVYNSSASYMLAAIVQKVTGMKVIDYLTPRLFEPLGIDSPIWETSPQGINVGGWGLNLTTEDLARFGQLYLQQGRWNGQPILPESWVLEATSRQVSNGSNPESDWEQGYGYQFWRCRHRAFRGEGAFGQYCIVIPEKDVVLAITGGVTDMQAVLNIIWECLLPEIGPSPLPTKDGAQKALAKKLANLKLPPPRGQSSSPVAGQVSGKTFRLEDNDRKIESVQFNFSEKGCVFQANCSTSPEEQTGLRMGGVVGQHQVALGDGGWQEGTTSLFIRKEQSVFASGVWTGDDTYVMTFRLVNTPYVFNYICQFTGDKVSMKQVQNVSFGPKDTPVLVGHSS